MTAVKHETTKYEYDVFKIVESEYKERISEGEEIDKDSLYEDQFIFDNAAEDVLNAIGEELAKRFQDWKYGMFISIASNTDWRKRSGYKFLDLRDENVMGLLYKASGGLIDHAYQHWSVEFNNEGYFDLYIPHHDANTTCEVWFLPNWLEQKAYNTLLSYRKQLQKNGYYFLDKKRDKKTLIAMLCNAIQDGYAEISYNAYGNIDYLVD